MVFCTALQAGALGHLWVRIYGALGTREECLNLNRSSIKPPIFLYTGWEMKSADHTQTQEQLWYDGWIWWLSNPCPKLCLIWSVAVERENCPQRRSQRDSVRFFPVSLSDSLSLGSITTPLAPQLSAHQVLIAKVLAWDHHCHKWKSSLCCGLLGCWQYLEIQPHADGACVV